MNFSKSLVRPANSAQLAKPLAAFAAVIALVVSFATPSVAAGEGVFTLGTTSGPTAGGTSVVITGTLFDETADDGPTATYVKFGTNNATSFVVNSATQITAVAPAGSAGPVSVTVGDRVLASAYTYAAAPTITSASPLTGPLGGTNSVVITGTNFIGVSGAAAVTFGGTNATSYTVNSTTQITAVAPAKTAGAVSVVVVAAGGTATKTTAYTYVSSPPAITSLGTITGTTAGGTSVVITGTNFHGVSGAASVKFGSTNATSYVVNSTTQITAVAPAGTAGTVSVVVVAVDGTATLGAAYTYRTPSTAVSTTERIFFSSGSSDIRSSQYETFADLMTAVEGKTGLNISVTSRRWSTAPKSLAKSRNTSVVRMLKLLGLEGANITYNRFSTRSSKGTSGAKKNNRVSIAISWTN
jgi:hypothetical protein